MATKNHFSNYENLFSAYRDSISMQNNNSKGNIEQDIKNAKIRLERFITELAEINNFLANPPKKRLTVDTRKSQEFEPVVREATAEFEAVKNSNPTLSEKARQSAITTLEFDKQRESKTQTVISELTKQIEDPNTTPSTIPSLKAKRTKAQNLLKSINDNITNYSNIIKEDNEKIAKIADAQKKLDNALEKQKAILEDEKKYKINAVNENSSIAEKIEKKKIRRRTVVVEKNKLIKEIEELEKLAKTVPTSTTGSIDEFKKFLKDNSFSTVHAEELFELYKNPNHKLSSLTKNEFKLRKQHPKRDRFLKKFLLPTTLTAGGVGLGCGAVASAIATGGSQWLWIQFTSNAAVNFLQAALPGATIGAAAAITTITLKDFFTKLYYKNTYGDVNKILNNPESAKLEELLEKIENTKDDILDLRTGNKNIFSRFGRAVNRTFKNIVNRNRVHHIEAITEQLVEKFNNIINNQEISTEVKLEKLTPIYDILTKINNFYAKDIKKSKIFAMLNCKETNKNHTHKETIENLDIYAKLNMYLEDVTKLQNASKLDKKKVHKEVKEDLTKQNAVAERLLNGESVTGLVAKRYLELVKASDKNQTPVSKTIDSYIINNGELQISFKDGKTSIYQVENTEQIKNVESVNKGKTLIITYKNGEQISISSTVPKTKINLNVAGEFKVYDKLQEVAVIDYLVEQKGIEKDTIFALIDALKSTKFNKNGKEKAKPTAFMKSKAYKENPEYAKIIKEVAAIIKNPNIVNMDYGFKA